MRRDSVIAVVIRLMKNLSISDALERIAKQSDGEIKFAPPATKMQFHELEKTLGQSVPEGLSEYLAVANGELPESGGLFGCDDRLLSAEQILAAIHDHETDENPVSYTHLTLPTNREV